MTTAKNTKMITRLAVIGSTVYGISLLGVSVLLIADPVGLNIKTLIVPLLMTLLVSSLAFSYRIARSPSLILSCAATVSLGVMFTMIGFFVVAGVAWLVGLSHV